MNKLPAIYRLGTSVEDDFPHIRFENHGPQVQQCLAIDNHVRAGGKAEKLLSSAISFTTKRKKRWRTVDCIDMVPGIGVSARCKSVLESLGVAGLEFMPFMLDGEPFYLFYTSRSVDCLNYNLSLVQCYECDPSKVMSIRRYRFDRKELAMCDIFTIPEESDGMFFWSQSTYLTEHVKEAFESARLVGFRFTEVEDYRNPLTSLIAPYVYENDSIGLRLKIPDTWSIVTWRRNDTGRACGFQTKDDDFPNSHNEGRSLIKTEFLALNSPIEVHARVELCIYYKDSGTDPAQEFKANMQHMRRTIDRWGQWQVNGTDFSYADEIVARKPEVSAFRFAWTPIGHNLWLHATIAGYSPGYYEAAFSVFNTLELVPPK